MKKIQNLIGHKIWSGFRFSIWDETQVRRFNLSRTVKIKMDLNMFAFKQSFNKQLFNDIQHD